MVLLGLVGSFFVLFLLRNKKSKHKSRRMIIIRQLVNFTQMVGALSLFRAQNVEVFSEAVSVVTTVTGSVFGFYPVKCALQFSYFINFVFIMAIPLVVLAVATIDVRWLFQNARSKFRNRKVKRRQPRGKIAQTPVSSKVGATGLASPAVLGPTPSLSSVAHPEMETPTETETKGSREFNEGTDLAKNGTNDKNTEFNNFVELIPFLQT